MPIQKFPFLSFEEQPAPPEATPQVSAEPVAELPEVESLPVDLPPVPEPAAPTITEDDLEQRYKEGMDAGYKKAMAEKEQDEEKLQTHISETLHQIGIQIVLMYEEYNDNIKKNTGDLAAIAVAVAKKIAGQALKENPQQEVESIIEKCLASLYRELTIDITVHPSLEENIREKITTLLHEKGFKGELIVRGNESLGESDCTIEWKDGFAESNKQGLLEEIDAIVAGMEGSSKPEEGLPRP